MSDMSRTPAAGALRIACLCAGWCRTCDHYAAVFDAALAPLRAERTGLVTRWIDIEDESDLVGDFDVETFPTVVVLDDLAVRFAGPLTPQPETLQRVLRTAVQASDEGAPATVQPAAIEAFAARLRQQPTPTGRAE